MKIMNLLGKGTHPQPSEAAELPDKQQVGIIRMVLSLLGLRREERKNPSSKLLFVETVAVPPPNLSPDDILELAEHGRRLRDRA